MSILVSHADTTTTDNLLNNPNFTTDTSGWTLSDTNQNKVKRDPATYSGSASKSVRFRYQGGNISQDVDISGVSENHLIKEINMNFDSIGCGNTGGQWCTAGADDTVVSTITLSTESITEVLSESIAVPYEDGWESYSFTKDVLGDFNTDDISLNLTITGNDTGNSGNWWGPIIDNLSLTLTTEQYVAPEPEPEPQVEVEPEIETLIEGLDLSTELVNDIILDTPIEVAIIDPLPEIEEITEVEEIIEIDVAVDIEPEIDTTVEIQVEPTVDIVDEIPEIEIVEEIQEIEVNEPIEEIVEVEIEEQPEELAEDTMEDDIAEADESIEESQDEPEQEAESENETNDDSELSEADSSEEADNKESKTSNESKVVKKSKSKDKKSSKKNGSKKTTNKDKKSNENNKTVAKKSTIKNTKSNSKTNKNTDSLGQISITSMVYLQMIPETIKIQETVSLTQEMIYEQDISAFTSSATYDNLISSSSGRWIRMVDVRPKHTFGGYGR